MNRTFKLPNPGMYLNPYDWKASFLMFYKASCLISDAEDLYDKTFGKTGSDRYILSINSTVKDQLNTLQSIINNDSRLKDLLINSSDEYKNALINRAKNIFGATINKLKMLKITTEPEGWENLTIDKEYIYRKSRSIESYDNHRIIYDMKSYPYKVHVTSILGHYKDSPIDINDDLIRSLELKILDCYQLLEGTFKKSDINKLNKLLDSSGLS